MPWRHRKVSGCSPLYSFMRVALSKYPKTFHEFWHRNKDDPLKKECTWWDHLNHSYIFWKKPRFAFLSESKVSLQEIRQVWLSWPYCHFENHQWRNMPLLNGMTFIILKLNFNVQLVLYRWLLCVIERYILLTLQRDTFYSWWLYLKTRAVIRKQIFLGV